MMKSIHTEKAPAAIGPYSQAIMTGNANGRMTIYTSGQIPIDPATGAVITGGIAAQTAQVLENLKQVLEAAGSSLAKVVKTTLFIRNMDEFATINEIYATYFTAPFPARSTVEVARLPKDVLIEIEAVAIMEDVCTIL